MNITPETQAMAQRVLDYIHEHPEQHDQKQFFGASYDCGTTMCIAGTALFLEYGIQSDSAFYQRDFGLTFTDVAGPLLGLDENEADDLFYKMDNEIAVQMLKCIIAGDEYGFRAYAEYETDDDEDDE